MRTLVISLVLACAAFAMTSCAEAAQEVTSCGLSYADSVALINFIRAEDQLGRMQQVLTDTTLHESAIEGALSEMSASKDKADNEGYVQFFKLYRFTAVDALQQLGYDPGSWGAPDSARFVGAISRFQRDLEIPATGVVDAETAFWILLARRVVRSPMLLGGVIDSYLDFGTEISARGCWRAKQNELIYPNALVEIVCKKRFMTCDVRTMSFTLDANMVMIGRPDVESLDIVAWTDNQVVAESGEGSWRKSLTIHRPSKSIEMREWFTDGFWPSATFRRNEPAVLELASWREVPGAISVQVAGADAVALKIKVIRALLEKNRKRALPFLSE